MRIATDKPASSKFGHLAPGTLRRHSSLATSSSTVSRWLNRLQIILLSHPARLQSVAVKTTFPPSYYGKSYHHGHRLRGSDRGPLYRTGQFGAAGPHRDDARRAAYDHEHCRKFSR